MRTMMMVVATLATALACTNEGPTSNDPDAGNGVSSCDDLNWRAPTENFLACPQTDDCSCGGSNVCCVEYSDGDVRGATCEEFRSCRGLAFECDGPEDCSADTVCCANLPTAGGGGSSCTAERDCFGVNSVVLCRGSEDCPLGDDCSPAAIDTYFEGVVGFCN